MSQPASELTEIATLRAIADRGKAWLTVAEYEQINTIADTLSAAMRDAQLLEWIIRIRGLELRTTAKDEQAWPGGVDWSAHKGEAVGYGMNGPRDAIVALVQKLATAPYQEESKP